MFPPCPFTSRGRSVPSYACMQSACRIARRRAPSPPRARLPRKRQALSQVQHRSRAGARREGGGTADRRLLPGGGNAPDARGRRHGAAPAAARAPDRRRGSRARRERSSWPRSGRPACASPTGARSTPCSSGPLAPPDDPVERLAALQTDRAAAFRNRLDGAPARRGPRGDRAGLLSRRAHRAPAAPARRRRARHGVRSRPLAPRRRSGPRQDDRGLPHPVAPPAHGQGRPGARRRARDAHGPVARRALSKVPPDVRPPRPQAARGRREGARRRLQPVRGAPARDHRARGPRPRSPAVRAGRGGGLRAPRRRRGAPPRAHARATSGATPTAPSRRSPGPRATCSCSPRRRSRTTRTVSSACSSCSAPTPTRPKREFLGALERGEPLPPCTSATRRADIGGFQPRVAAPVDLASEPAGMTGDLEGDAGLRVAWLARRDEEWRAAGTAKTLVFVRDRGTLSALKEKLESATRKRVAIFHEALTPGAGRRRGRGVPAARRPVSPDLDRGRRRRPQLRVLPPARPLRSAA